MPDRLRNVRAMYSVALTAEAHPSRAQGIGFARPDDLAGMIPSRELNPADDCKPAGRTWTLGGTHSHGVDSYYSPVLNQGQFALGDCDYDSAPRWPRNLVIRCTVTRRGGFK